MEETRMGRDKDSIKNGFAMHLKYDMGVDRFSATDLDKYKSISMTIRDRIIGQWLETQRTHHKEGAKRVYYLSLEFLIGRSLINNIINLGIKDQVMDAMAELGYNLENFEEQEQDAGLGNGGLGRLAACFLDSLATLGYPAFGYGIRYDYGIFKQTIENGNQIENPDDWMRHGNPWEIERPEFAVTVNFGGKVISSEENGRLIFRWTDTKKILGIPYDIPIVGYGGKTINTLRLWSAKSVEEFSFHDFNKGDYFDSVNDKMEAENITKVLYPNDTKYLGKELRLKQQYFFVACSLSDIIRRFKSSGKPMQSFPERAALQLNDTHPSIAVVELMRLLLDVEKMSWEDAWKITLNSTSYTNHTLMPEALEKWSVVMFENLLPRHLQIIYQINYEFLSNISIKYKGNVAKLRNMSIIEEGNVKNIRMAYLAIVSTHVTNGVAELHSKLIKSNLVPDFADMFPDRFQNKTNGITQRRWLLKANPPLANLVTEALGSTDWITDLFKLKGIEKFSDDAVFLEKFKKVKKEAKSNLAQTLKKLYNFDIDTSFIFDIQVKRIHEYKRQFLNALHIIMLYGKIKNEEINKNTLVPRLFLFGGKAAPGYYMAKLVIKLINNIANVVNKDADVNDVLRVHFIPNYNVSIAEKIIASADVSEQISLAGTEASGTGNMKFMLNGALTLGTLDGANIEIKNEVGDENIYIFGLTEEQVLALKPSYDPYKYYNTDLEIRETVKALMSNIFVINEDSGIFEPFKRMLFEMGDNYMHFADFSSYKWAHEKIMEDYKNEKLWFKKSIINVANSGKFSSDRTIHEYAKEIWNLKSIDVPFNVFDAIEEATNHK